MADTATTATPTAPSANATLDPPPSKLGKFIVRYPTFISSLVVGIAGLIATTIWQYRNFHSQRETAAAQQKIAETQAANSWKIERAEILGKNLQTLAASGTDTLDQRYGVLLSLTRAEIIDPELALSYALELGKDRVEYMQSVLANTPNKDYSRLLRAYSLSCEERFGVSPAIDACQDRLAPRSDALGELVGDELAIAMAGEASTTLSASNPLSLLKDERKVQANLAPLTGLFETAITNLYEHRQWDDLDRLAKTSPGAHLVVSLIVAAARTGEFVTDDEAKALDQMHATHTKWLADYLASKPCDAECKGKMVEIMISHYSESQGDFDKAMRALLEGARNQAGAALSRLHTRLLWCQVDDSDLEPLRDRVLVPAATDLLAHGDPTARDGVLSLLALVAEPTPPDPAWTAMMTAIDHVPATATVFRDRRAAAAKQRRAPPAALRKWNFCGAPSVAPSVGPSNSGSNDDSLTMPTLR